MKKILLIIFMLTCCCCWSSQILAQSIIKGKVTTAEEGFPLPGVSVKVKGSTNGTQTDVNGLYSIKANRGQVLVFSFVGAITQERTVGNLGTINVVLKQDAKSLSEVVVTAFGVKQSRRSLGYQAQQLDSTAITNTNQQNVLNALEGKVAGAQITRAGGSVGAGTRIQLRGINSLNPSANNQPLFIVDGIPVSNNTDQFGGSGGDSFQNTNRIADINPDDIETITVLKGPSASVLYGLRAANGAIVITTKSGKNGPVSVNYRASYSFDDVASKPPIQTTYGNGNNGAYISSLNTWGPLVQNGLPTYNPYDEFFKVGHQLQNMVDISGGTDKATYYSSIENDGQTGVVPFSTGSKTSFKLAGTLKASDKFKVSGSANYINNTLQNPRTGVSSGAIYYLERHTNTANPADYLNPDGSEKVYSPSLDNPFYFSKNAYLKSNVNRIIGNIGFDYNPISWLTISYKVGIDNYTDARQAYIAQGLIISRLGAMDEERLSYNEINSNLLIRASKQFSDKWSGNFLVGQAYTTIKSSSLFTNASQAIVPGFVSLNNYSVYSPTISTPYNKNIIGVFGDANIGYANTVYLDITGRNDWSSTLPVNNRSFFYPSASLSYIFTETLGLKNNPIFNFGKLRLSYAEVGKDADPYQIGLYYSTVQAFNGVSGVRQSTTVGANDLRPERTKGLEFGGEFHFLKDRLSLDANYAITNSIDQIVPVPVSYASGFSVFVTNAGKIRNNSIELLLTGNVVRNKDWKVDVNANWSSTKGRVLSMPPGVSEIAFQPATPWVKQIIKTGGRPGDWYGWPYLRVQDPSSQYNGQLIIGANGLPSVTPVLANNFYVGNAFPDWTGGFGSSIGYKGFNFSFQFSLRRGGKVFDISRYQRYTTGIGAESALRNVTVIFKGVQSTPTGYVPNTTPVFINQTLYTNLYGYEVATENNGFEDASWIRLQNVSLSYTFPKSWLGGTFIKDASVFVTGDNLWVSTPFLGFDPESSTYGAGSNAVGYVGTDIPTTRSLFVGLNVKF